MSESITVASLDNSEYTKLSRRMGEIPFHVPEACHV